MGEIHIQKQAPKHNAKRERMKNQSLYISLAPSWVSDIKRR